MEDNKDQNSPEIPDVSASFYEAIEAFCLIYKPCEKEEATLRMSMIDILDILTSLIADETAYCGLAVYVQLKSRNYTFTLSPGNVFEWNFKI